MSRVLRHIFSEIKSQATQLWPSHRTKKWTALSSVFFNRFVCLAILDPVGFDFVLGTPEDLNKAHILEQPSMEVKRDLIMISKTLQKLSSLILFDEQQETHMVGINPFLIENMDKLRGFIDDMSTPMQTQEEVQKLRKSRLTMFRFNSTLPRISRQKWL